MDLVFGRVFSIFFKNPDDNFKLIFLEDSTLDNTEVTEISELLVEEEGAGGFKELPSQTNASFDHTMSDLIPLQRIAISVRHKKHRDSKTG